MTKRPMKTNLSSARSVPERMPVEAANPARADAGPALSDELRSPGPQHGLTLREAMSQHAMRVAASTLPAASADVSASMPPVPDPEVRRSARALVPILADGTLYLPGTDTEMVPLTFEAYGELVAARLIEPLPWDSLDVASVAPTPLTE